MAPTASKCPKCSEGIHGRQKRLPCKICEEVYHAACVEVRSEEVSLFFDGSGNSKYTCETCLKKPKGDGTPISGKMTGRNSSPKKNKIDTTKGKYDDDPKYDVKTKCKCEEIIPIIVDMKENFHDKIEQLVSTIVSMKDMVEKLSRDNESLKGQVAELLATRTDVSDCNGEMAQTGSGNNGRSRRNRNRMLKSSVQQPVVSDVQELTQAESVAGVPATTEHDVVEEGNDDNRMASQPSSWSKVVGRNRNKDAPKKPQGQPFKISSNKKKKNIIVGKGAENMHLAKPRKRALFATRFEEGVKRDEVEDLIKTAANIDVTCTKLRTKRAGYSSFHVLVSAEDYDKLVSPDVWPRGVLVLPYYGKLAPDSVYREDETKIVESKENEAPEEGNNSIHNGS